MFFQVMEEREIKMMRKEMVPTAQLMPAFHKPFHPQRQLLYKQIYHDGVTYYILAEREINGSPNHH
jgi:hypothetical protein